MMKELQTIATVFPTQKIKGANISKFTVEQLSQSGIPYGTAVNILNCPELRGEEGNVQNLNVIMIASAARSCI
jgi:hypothetical protein